MNGLEYYAWHALRLLDTYEKLSVVRSQCEALGLSEHVTGVLTEELDRIRRVLIARLEGFETGERKDG